MALARTVPVALTEAQVASPYAPVWTLDLPGFRFYQAYLMKPEPNVNVSVEGVVIEFRSVQGHKSVVVYQRPEIEEVNVPGVKVQKADGEQLAGRQIRVRGKDAMLINDLLPDGGHMTWCVWKEGQAAVKVQGYYLNEQELLAAAEALR
jgi:hypothetical protein